MNKMHIPGATQAASGQLYAAIQIERGLVRNEIRVAPAGREVEAGGEIFSVPETTQNIPTDCRDDSARRALANKALITKKECAFNAFL